MSLQPSARSSSDSLSWVPDWAGQPINAGRRGRAEAPESLPLPERSGLLVPSVGGGTTDEVSIETTAVETDNQGGDGFARRQKDVIVTPSPDRTVKRKLSGIHLFMITINATLGTGLYWRGGQILEVGGPLAVPISFLFVGFISWAVMQCITEMLCIWPIPGALSAYVGEFVDAELGIAVGIAYWFTYSVSFSAINATLAAELHFWMNNRAFDGIVVYAVIPFVLIGINLCGIKTYGNIEVLFGSIKSAFLVIICVLVGISTERPEGEPQGVDYWKAPLKQYDRDAGSSWFICLCMSVSIASFAFVGVEVIAASALEAKWPKRGDTEASPDRSQSSGRRLLLIGRMTKFSAVWIPGLVTAAYTVAGTLTTFNMPRDNCRLPRLSWADNTMGECGGADAGSQTQHQGETISVFVAIAQDYEKIAHLPNVFNVFLVFTAVTCANTNLYVASRSLFGLTSRLDGGRDQPMLLRVLAFFGRTNDRKVPARAMLFSAFAFWWVPFLELKGGQGIGMFVEILAAMGSVGVLIVWACECLAFIRYYSCISKHRDVLEAQGISQVRRWSLKDRHDYPFRSQGQPGLAWVALLGCLAILLVANSASLWTGFHQMPFFSSYLIVIAFLAVYVLLKIVKTANWRWVNLDNPATVVNKIKDLHDIRLGAS